METGTYCPYSGLAWTCDHRGAALEALAYRHPWGPALIPGTAEAAVAQAEAEGHGAVLRTVSAFLAVVQDPRVKELLALVVTPESLPTWRRDLRRSRAIADNRGMATRAEYPAANVAYVKLPPDSGDTVRATGHVLLEGAVIVTLQLRPELPGGEELAGWRVHGIGDYIPPDELPKV